MTARLFTLVAIAIISATPARASAPLAIHPASELPQLITQLAHGRPLVLHFCASWCEACRTAFSREHKMLSGLKARGVSVALIWIDDEKTRKDIPAMIKRYQLGKLPALILDAPDSSQIAAAVAEPTWDGALPATFVYDGHQAKLNSFIGLADESLLQASIEEAIRRSK